MVKKLLLLFAILAGAALIKSYYFTPLIVGVALGTVVLSFITGIVGFPNASMPNAFLLAVGWIAITCVVGMLLAGPALSFILALVAYYLLIKTLYTPPALKVLILLTLSMILRRSIGLLLVPYFTRLVYLAAF